MEKTLQDVYNSVASSSRDHHNIPQLVNDDRHPEVFYNCKEMSKNYPGAGFVREYADNADIEINLFKKQFIDPIIVPTVLKANGSDANRQWYLFQEI
ncbi:hypothetical protein KUTeg_012443 [Tegillarca granosa]|uniref:Uncharacterized protein n=1 Tax=Tegillarca granosa TaxID=220873 RepID=A0ABQ9EZK5_TEGGR|nr:hypothetical protein KUTeg_012443 [Tegillarca granosa]